MFKDTQFYHEHIRKAIVAFGMIFNNIRIERRNTLDEIIQVMRVPLSYSTKQKFLSRIALIPDAESRGEVAIVLPRMGFEIQQLTYDPSRKVSPIQRNKAIGEGDNTNTVRSSFVATPYNMSLALYVFAKNQEDGLRIIEQILPFFNPDFNITVNELPVLGIKRDIKITLDNIDYDDNYEGDLADRQSIIWTLNFTMRLNFYGPVTNSGIIKESIAKLYENDDLSAVRVKSTSTVGINGVTDNTLTPADEYEYITTILESFGEEIE
jgi:hypothetical protein